MPDLINKLSTYAALVGVICTIGGGFYAWGEFSTRLNAVENVSYESVDLTNIHDRITAGDKDAMEAVRSLAAAFEDLFAPQTTQYDEYGFPVRTGEPMDLAFRLLKMMIFSR